MNLDTELWELFQINKILEIQNGKGITQEEIEENAGNFVAVQSAEDNNGVMGKISLDYCKKMDYTYTERPCLTVARSGTAGFVSFQRYGCVVGDSAKILLLEPNVASTEVYLFIQTILSANRYKYNYGRKVTEDNYGNDWIALPIQHDADGDILFDETKKYSENGYIPDWKFMEDYIKSLRYKEISTKNNGASELTYILETNLWQDFLLDNYFDIFPGIYHYPEEYEEGNTPYYSAANTNNGIASYINLPPDFEGNCIVTGKIGCTAFYVPTSFCATSDVNIFRPKFNMTSAIGLFIVTVLNYGENYKWAYGRQCRVGNSKQISISLPAILNPKTDEYEPDWESMEKYIKSLPYGDRIPSPPKKE